MNLNDTSLTPREFHAVTMLLLRKELNAYELNENDARAEVFNILKEAKGFDRINLRNVGKKTKIAIEKWSAYDSTNDSIEFSKNKLINSLNYSVNSLLISSKRIEKILDKLSSI